MKTLDVRQLSELHLWEIARFHACPIARVTALDEIERRRQTRP